ncbi:hypothetical protein LBMAG53_26480 [Planctomycetota bacterium]|nr:hypothetical protein LBMAG53_26480 [Planctomycetota bacterium]
MSDPRQPPPASGRPPSNGQPAAVTVLEVAPITVAEEAGRQTAVTMAEDFGRNTSNTIAVDPAQQPDFKPPPIFRAPAEPPADLGGFRLGKKLGAGGMGAVYAAVQPGTGTTVALKVLKPDLAAVGSEFTSRFEREASAMQEVDHPNVVRLLGSGEDRGWLWMALEYMPDGDLASYLKRRGQLMEKDAIAYALRCGRGLAAVHAMGLIHRDFKPENVFLDLGRGKPGAEPSVKVGDLGLARHSSGDDRFTMTGTACGTPVYMAPEQIRGESDLDARVDVYALGATLFKLTTGQDPFRGATVFMLTNAVLKEPVPDPRKFNPIISAGLVAAILKAMAKERKDRYRDVGEMVTDLERLSAGKIMTNTAANTASPASMIFNEVAGQAATKASARETVAHEGDGWLSGLHGMGPVLRMAIPAVLICLAMTVLMWSMTGDDHDPAHSVKPAPTGPVAQVLADRWGHVLRLPVLGRELAFRWCPPGRMVRGSTAGPAWEKPQPVVLSQGFWMLDTEVSRGLWSTVMNEPPPAPVDAALPVGGLSREQAMGFCDKFGFSARLPSEAEFEYAARAGRSDRAGDERPAACSDETVLAVWSKLAPATDALMPAAVAEILAGRADLHSRVVGSSLPNAWGLCDLLGNQQEWCLDAWDAKSPFDQTEATDPVSEAGDFAVVRGGSWVHPAERCLPQARFAQPADAINEWTGFRFLIPGGTEPVVPKGLSATPHSSPPGPPRP